MQFSLEIAGANGWALRVHENGDGTAKFLRDSANSRDDLPHPIMLRMTHVEPKNIGTFVNQLPQHFGFLARRAERTNNFRLSHRSVRFSYRGFIFPSGRKGKIKTARMKRQVWAVIRIAQNLRAPFFLHVTGFAEQSLSIFRMGLVAARRGLVVDQICIRCPDNEPTAFTHTQTKIDVVEICGEILIEAIEIGENVSARYHAGGGDGGSILRQNESAMHRRDWLRRKTMKGVARHSIQSQHHSTMLQPSVRIPKSRADCPYLCADGIADHLAQPVSFLRFNVVVQERQNVTAR